MKKTGFFIAALAIFAIFSMNGRAMAAYSCSGSQQSYNNNCAQEQSSNAYTSPQLVGAASRQLAGLISARIESFRASAGGLKTLALNEQGKLGKGPALELGTGRGAGKGGNKLGVWVDSSWSDYKDKNASTKADGNIITGAFGLDYQADPNVVVGLAAGYENIDINTTFNRGSLKADGYTVAPYAVFNLNNMFSVDVSGGYTWLKYDVDRTTITDGATTFSGTKSTGSFDANRLFGSFNVNADYATDSWLLNGTVGTLYSSETQDAYTESNGTSREGGSYDVGRAIAGGKIGYDLGGVSPDLGGIVPYLKGSYEYDYSRQNITVQSSETKAANDDDRFIVGAGLSVAPINGISGGLEFTSVQGATSVTNYTVNGTLRLDF